MKEKAGLQKGLKSCKSIKGYVFDDRTMNREEIPRHVNRIGTLEILLGIKIEFENEISFSVFF